MNDISYWLLQEMRGRKARRSFAPNSFVTGVAIRECHLKNSDEPERNSYSGKTGFTWSGAVAGAKRAVPLAVADIAFGIAFGALARQANLSLAESVLMSGFVSAGTAQLVALDYWSSPLPIFTIVLTTLIVNLRHLLMGAAVFPYFSKLSSFQAYGTAFFMSDETWALTMHEFEEQRSDAAFMLGAGLLLLMTWVGGTAIGHGLGAVIDDPAKWGLDFVFIALFAVLLVGSWKGKETFSPWVAAAAVAVLTAHYLPGKWYILAGGVAGSLVGGIRSAR